LKGRPHQIAAGPRQYQGLGVQGFNINLPGFDISASNKILTCDQRHRRPSFYALGLGGGSSITSGG